MKQVAIHSDLKEIPPQSNIDEDEFKRRKEELKKMLGES